MSLVAVKGTLVKNLFTKFATVTTTANIGAYLAAKAWLCKNVARAITKAKAFNHKVLLCQKGFVGFMGIMLVN